MLYGLSATSAQTATCRKKILIANLQVRDIVARIEEEEVEVEVVVVVAAVVETAEIKSLDRLSGFAEANRDRDIERYNFANGIDSGA